MRTSEKTLFMQTVGKFVVDRISTAFGPMKTDVAELKNQVAQLTERVEALEASGIQYVGVYQRACQYRRGDVCTYEGAMWVAIMEAPPNEIPGHSVCWQLSVKSPGPRTRVADGNDAPRLPTASRPTHENATEHRRP
jgi:hypothetical protein